MMLETAAYPLTEASSVKLTLFCEAPLQNY